jgi:hypothetical protein
LKRAVFILTIVNGCLRMAMYFLPYVMQHKTNLDCLQKFLLKYDVHNCFRGWINNKSVDSTNSQPIELLLQKNGTANLNLCFFVKSIQEEQQYQ